MKEKSTFRFNINIIKYGCSACNNLGTPASAGAAQSTSISIKRKTSGTGINRPVASFGGITKKQESNRS